ncbi:MAG: hypothetical protein EU521_01210 [Promethearchaeota archaeon]|nr:MAG: hypothetical protein EU521_01210 [Candidatus Lokiarchaeota archaeon]
MKINNAETMMLEFAENTGLSSDKPPRRYLWTDAFAVFNFIQLFKQTNEEKYKQLAITLVDQVHSILGKHRKDDPREGWLSSKEHPTKKGLRIGKSLPERKPNEPLDQELEWERDGQYFHYLTKWMVALIKMGLLCDEYSYFLWAKDLVNASLAFIHDGHMYWKMSIDLTRPLIKSMGQHDPLNGYVAYKVVNRYVDADLTKQVDQVLKLAKSIQLPTTDPLGLGELLVYGYRLFQMKEDEDLISKILEAVKFALPTINKNFHGLAFRELGLAIGLEASKHMNILESYWKLKQNIVTYWLEHQDWREHKDINQVMLATSLQPEEFLRV